MSDCLTDDRDLSDWREWVAYCDEVAQAEAELEKEVPVPAHMGWPGLILPPLTPRKVLGYGGGWYDEERSPIPPYIPPAPVEPKCECGAKVCKTTHADWCPISNRK